MQGTLKNWHEERGYGFIIADDYGSDVFLHVSKLPEEYDSLPRGTELGFDVETRQDGKRAAINVNIIKLGTSAAPPTAAPAPVSRPEPKPAPAAAPQGGGAERHALWTPERRTEIAEEAAKALMDIGRGDAPDVTDATARVKAMRLLLQAVSEDARESYPGG